MPTKMLCGLKAEDVNLKSCWVDVPRFGELVCIQRSSNPLEVIRIISLLGDKYLNIARRWVLDPKVIRRWYSIIGTRCNGF